MFEFSPTEKAIGEALRQYCDREIEPLIPDLESGRISPFPVMKALADTFAMEELIGGPLRDKAAALRSGRHSRSEHGSAASGDAIAEATTDTIRSTESQPSSGSSLGDLTTAVIFAKELARVSPCLCLCVTANFGCGATIAAKGDAELLESMAIPLLSLQKVGCWGLTEPDTGSDAFAMRTTVRIEGDEAVLRGSKAFISNAPGADIFLIYARWDSESCEAGEAKDKRRIFPVVVERGAEGLATGPPLEKMGMHAAPTGEIFLDDVRVPRRQLLGDPDNPARAVAEETLSSERATIVAMCLGVIERCLDDSLAYAIDRSQFGKPIAAHQLIQQKLARMQVAKQNVENLVFKLLWLDKNRRATEAEVSAAKWYATEAACSVALEAVQLMGGAGYTRAYAAERMFRDMKLWTIGGGTSEIQQLTIAKDLLKSRGFFIDLAGGYEVRSYG